MSVPRAKKKKTHSGKPLTRADIDRLKAHYVDKSIELTMAAMARTLHDVYDWKPEKIDEFEESIGVLMQELTDGRTTADGFIRDCEDQIGVKIKGRWNR